MARYRKDEIYSAEEFRKLVEDDFSKVIAEKLGGWNIKLSDEPEFSCAGNGAPWSEGGTDNQLYDVHVWADHPISEDFKGIWIFPGVVLDPYKINNSNNFLLNQILATLRKSAYDFCLGEGRSYFDMSDSPFRRTHFGRSMGVGNYSCPSFEISVYTRDGQLMEESRKRTEQELKGVFLKEYEGVLNFVRLVKSKQFEDFYKSTVKNIEGFFEQPDIFNKLTPRIISS